MDSISFGPTIMLQNVLSRGIKQEMEDYSTDQNNTSNVRIKREIFTEDDESSNETDNGDSLERNKEVQIRKKKLLTKEPQVHPGYKNIHKCLYCEYKSGRKDHVRRHMNALHLKKKKKKSMPYKCSDCSFNGVTMHDLEKHARVHHPKNIYHVCPTCEYETDKYEDLENHFIALHQMFARQCKHCNYRFDNPTDYNMHSCVVNSMNVASVSQTHFNEVSDSDEQRTPKLINNNTEPDLTEDMQASSSSRKFRIHLISSHSIGKIYHPLEAHIKTFEPISCSHRCNDCEYMSATDDDMIKHITTHHTNEPCREENSKKFKSNNSDQKRSNVSKHSLGVPGSSSSNHSNNKSFDCTECNFHTSEYLLLKRHYLTDHLIGNDERKNLLHEITSDFVHKLDRNTLPFPVSDQFRYGIHHECSLCDYKTTKAVNLNRHIKSIHAVYKSYQCSHCGFSTAETKELIEHVASLHERFYECPDCSFKTTNVDQMNMHTTVDHTGGNIQQPSKSSVIDPQCSKEKIVPDVELNSEIHLSPLINVTLPLLKDNNLKPKNKSRHINKKPKVKEMNKCSVCSYKTMYPTHLTRHFLAIHSKEKPHKCTQCDFSAVESINLRRHIMSKHPREKPYQCPDCDYATSNERDMKRHQCDHRYSYSCRMCEFKTSVNKLLKKHNATFHEKKCDNCNFITYNSVKLLQHIKSSHKKENTYRKTRKEKSEKVYDDNETIGIMSKRKLRGYPKCKYAIRSLQTSRIKKLDTSINSKRSSIRNLSKNQKCVKTKTPESRDISGSSKSVTKQLYSCEITTYLSDTEETEHKDPLKCYLCCHKAGSASGLKCHVMSEHF